MSGFRFGSEQNDRAMSRIDDWITKGPPETDEIECPDCTEETQADCQTCNGEGFIDKPERDTNDDGDLAYDISKGN